MTGTGIISGVRQQTVVGAGGKIEIVAPSLPPGISVEVLVFVEPVEQETTKYLLSTQANRQHLLQALEDLQDCSRYTFVDVNAL